MNRLEAHHQDAADRQITGFIQPPTGIAPSSEIIDGLVGLLEDAGVTLEKRATVSGATQLKFRCPAGAVQKCLEVIEQYLALRGLVECSVFAESLVPAPIVDPTDYYLDFETIKSLTSLRIRVAFIHVQPSERLWAQSEFATQIGEELQAAGLGRIDSSKWSPSIIHFFHCPEEKIASALTAIRDAVQKRGLLQDSKIGFLHPETGRGICPEIKDETK
jgi:hypothetical protein